jgi:hypothetical protein
MALILFLHLSLRLSVEEAVVDLQFLTLTGLAAAQVVVQVQVGPLTPFSRVGQALPDRATMAEIKTLVLLMPAAAAAVVVPLGNLPQ